MSSSAIPYEIIIDQSAGEPVRKARVYLTKNQIDYLQRTFSVASNEMRNIGMYEDADVAKGWSESFGELGGRIERREEMDCGV